MALYVDNLSPTWPAAGWSAVRPGAVGKWSRVCRLLADSTDELESACGALGLSPSWIVSRGRPDEHVTLIPPKRAEAVRILGARELSDYDAIELVWRRRPPRSAALERYRDPVAAAGDEAVGGSL